MHQSHFHSAIDMNKQSGFIHQDLDWFKKLYKMDGVFSMAVFGSSDCIIGWSTYRKTSSGMEILWMIVDDGLRYRGIGTAMINRMKGWMEAMKYRRGALTCNVHQYADDMLYFLRDRDFTCIKINPVAETYRMIWLGESKKDRQ